jgi:hypothetical protein
MVLIVLTTLLTAFVSVQKSDAYVDGRSKALDDMRFSMARMTRDIRQGVTVEPTSTASRLAVTTYVGGVQQPVVFDASGSALTRQVGSEPAVELQAGLASSDVFQYAPGVAGAEVVTITLSVIPPNAPDTTVTIDSEVRLRNLEEAT